MTFSGSCRLVVSALALVFGISSSLAADTPEFKAPPRTVADITQMLDQYKPDSKKAEGLRAILESQPPQTTDRKDLARFYLKRALAAEEAGAVLRQVEDYRKVVELGGAEDLAYEVDRLTIAEVNGGSAVVAVEMLQRAIARTAPGRGENISLRVRLANAYLTLGDLAKAQESLLDAEATNRSYSSQQWWASYRHVYAGDIESTRARLFSMRGKPTEADAMLRKALEERTADVAMARFRKTMRMNYALDEKMHVFSAEILRANLAYILIAQGRLSDAEATARQALATIGPLFGGYTPQTGAVLLPLAGVLMAQGRYAEARRIAEMALDIFLKSGAVADSNSVRRARLLLASTFAAQGNYGDALREYQIVHDAYAASPAAQAQFAGGNLGWSIALLKTAKPDESLAMLDQLIPKSQQWLGDKHLATMELVGVKAMALAVKGDKPAALDAFRSALLKLILEAYLGLLGDIRNTPLETAAGIDAAAEAFRLADALRSQSTQGAVAASALRAAANDPKIGAEIRKEQDLTQEMVALHKILRDLMNAPADQQLPKVIADMKARIETIKKERIAAHRLYTELLVPVAAGWAGATHLLVAANGALGQLPLATLPTAKVTLKPDPKLPYAKFKDVPWLIRQAAFTQLPSVNALVALRKLPAANAQRSAFIGFGDPQFTTTPIQIASTTRRLRNLSVSRPSQAEVEQAKPVEWMDYARIPPLPDTRDEILALAQALKADPNADVFLGSQASRANVKKLDLSKRRVMAFATHGLLAGDFPGVSEPSLALANPGGGQHGLLTLEDIMGLKLDADWVVLSACNTAGGDGQGADALSGLGRGFFYAGSRALLVTHWPVESVSARLLVTGLFERQAADAKLSRVEALRQSMLALMQQKSTTENFAYAHPLFWAPYALVGEGGI